ncbi:GNAT family N-acetyltransferase [Flavobacterium sp. P21]|uniref:GNAT family N-acetyltransferase n=1 Tax=Flavobacterium sp. P21 TaxID=3423948 RepID=UPI003D67E379
MKTVIILNKNRIMETIYQIKKIETELEIEQCWDVAFVLRPHLDKTKWKPTIAEMMQNEKYNIAGIMDQNKVVAFAGYRIMTSLHSGNIIYIDDLCTLESHRGKGLATQLLKHVEEIAISLDKDYVVLDTAFTNNTAQKVYLKNGFALTAVHLSNKLK